MIDSATLNSIRLRQEQRTRPHSLQFHPQSAQNLMAGGSNAGSASCSCNGWRVAMLDNRAGTEATHREFDQHTGRLAREAQEDLTLLLELIDD